MFHICYIRVSTVDQNQQIPENNHLEQAMGQLSG